MKKRFFRANDILIEGVQLFESNVSQEGDVLVYDEIVYAQNRIVQIHCTMKPGDKNWNESISILVEYAQLEGLEHLL